MTTIESDTINQMINEINSFECNLDEIAVSFSGGKDSLAVLDLASRIGIKNAVFSNTTIEFDETIDYIEKIKIFYDINIEVVQSELEFFDTVKKIGFPSRRSRWCCDIFKFAPINEYAKKNNIRIFITGLRKDESSRRNFYNTIDENPLLPYIQYNPILDWTEKDVWNYIDLYSLPYNPLYDCGFSRIGCWCCPYNNKDDWELMRELYPHKMVYLNGMLEEEGNLMKIPNKDKFVNSSGWTSWVSPVRKISIGSINECENKYEDNVVINIKLDGNKEIYNNYILKVLPILTDLFWELDDGTIKIIIKNNKKKKLKMLVEKAINCISCGVCLSQCPTSALGIDEDSIFVDPKKCTKCGACLNASRRVLRGACIVRNYDSRAKILTNLVT